jgi:hypothetical protein
MRFFFTRTLFKFFILSLILNFQLQAQDTLSFWTPSPEYNPKRVKLLAFSLTGAYAAGMTGLYQLWYKDYPHTKFHSFNDNNEWLQMDKAGILHLLIMFGKWGIGLFNWTGMNHKKANWYGGMLGLTFMTSIEIFDGFSSQWDFQPEI